MAKGRWRPVKGWDKTLALEKSREELQQKAKKPRQVIALNGVQVDQIYLAEVAVGPTRFVRIRKMKPQKLADLLHDWGGKDETLLAMVRPPFRTYTFFKNRGYEYPAHVAEYSNQMAARYRQAWHRPFASPRLDSICYALFERRWPVDMNALQHRLRKDLHIPYGSGAYCPKESLLALAAAFVTARTWQGAEYRSYRDGL